MTPNKEDYLKCIHELGEKQTKITNKQIAEMMQVSAPAVSEMVKKMIVQNWIVKDKALGYCLTKKGLLRVSELYRKHRLIEVFLVNHLHYTTDEIHQEAEVLEHTVSTTFIDRLDENLGFPVFCPHGGTIPKKGEFLVEIYQQTLSQAEQLGRYRIGRLHDNYQLLAYMAEQHLSIGMAFDIIKIDDYTKTLTITYDDDTLTVPEVIAKQIYIEKI